MHYNKRIKMPKYVKIKIEDEEGMILKTHYLRVDEWDLPAGKIEDNENQFQAAVRELIERTGYRIKENDLKESCIDGEFYMFIGQKKDLVQVVEPGEKGGYSTDIKWD